MPGDGESQNDQANRSDATPQPSSAEAKRQPPAGPERSLEFRKLLQRFVDVCNAIEYAHSKGILHRDLKPGNIMLGQYGETLVVDWGLAKVMKQGAGKTGEPKASAKGVPATQVSADPEATAQHTPATDGATMYGQALGTPQYMSPEQAAGKLDELGPRSDVYSLGATLYTLLTGKAPFSGKTIDELLEHVRQGKFPSPRSVHAETPPALEAICLKAMSLKPTHRYATPRALADDAEHWLADERVTAYRETFTERAARWSRTHRTAVTSALALTATAVIALVLGLIAVSAEQRETDRQRKVAVAAQTEEAAQRKLADDRKADADRQRDLAIATSARSNFLLAAARWKENRVEEARQLLEAIPPEHRKFEWYLARRQYQGGDVTLYGHVGGIAFSPDGRLLASGSSDKMIKLWDTRTGVELQTLTGHTDWVTDVEFSPDGSQLVSAGADKMIKIWDVERAAAIRTLDGHTERVSNVRFSPDGSRIAAASGKSIKIWDAQSGTELHTFNGHSEGVI